MLIDEQKTYYVEHVKSKKIFMSLFRVLTYFYRYGIATR